MKHILAMATVAVLATSMSPMAAQSTPHSSMVGMASSGTIADKTVSTPNSVAQVNAMVQALGQLLRTNGFHLKNNAGAWQAYFVRYGFADNTQEAQKLYTEMTSGAGTVPAHSYLGADADDPSPFPSLVLYVRRGVVFALATPNDSVVVNVPKVYGTYDTDLTGLLYYIGQPTSEEQLRFERQFKEWLDSAG